ncbi:MAG: hypothetical protein CM15mP102_07890 [Flavobacteriales bacterium]|nr:MAG: hypothetical protein CM15mP102_07890 [Flavobacteriales bacterium]
MDSEELKISEESVKIINNALNNKKRFVLLGLQYERS